VSGVPAGAMKVRGIAKRYRTGQPGDMLPDLRETLMSPFSRRPTQEGRPPFWALRDINFDVQPGEILGILGRNGAGKSTLLKILSRIVHPTAGRIDMAGRLGCLLEVGTGFHRELTGRENVYLNGAILGMSRREIGAKLDAIVDFAGIAAFIDTPVKHYSSGMYLRLGFAVAAHVEPEILIIDEVLTVGDAAFQAKCIRKVEELVKDGRTVLIVSHQLALVQKLCSRAIMIQEGVVVADGRPDAIIGDYLSGLDRHLDVDLRLRTDRRGRGHVRLVGLQISGGDGASVAAGGPALFEFEVSSAAAALECVFTIYDSLGEPVCTFDTTNGGGGDSLKDGPRRSFRCHVPALNLRPGRYSIGMTIMSHDGETEDDLEIACTFDVLSGFIGGREIIADPACGRVEFPHRWSAA